MLLSERLRQLVGKPTQTETRSGEYIGVDLGLQMYQDLNGRLRAENQGQALVITEQAEKIRAQQIQYEAKIAELEIIIAQSILEQSPANQQGVVIALTNTPSNLKLALDVAHEQEESPAEFRDVLNNFIFEIEKLSARMDGFFSYFIDIYSKEFPVSISFRYSKKNQVEQLDFVVVGTSGTERKVLNCSRVVGDTSNTFIVTAHLRHQDEMVTKFCLELAEKCARLPTNEVSILQHFTLAETTTLMGYTAEKPGILALEQPATNMNNQLHLMHLLDELSKSL